MSKTILNIPNSFVTFYDLVTNAGKSEFITNTECGIQKDFCYPIYDEKDLSYQFNVASTEVLTSSNVIAYIVVNGEGSTLTGVTLSIATNGNYLGVPIYNIYVNYSTSDLTQGLSDGDCFQLQFVIGTNEAELKVLISNQCFKKVNDKCLTSKLTYVNTSNAFGFVYRSYGTFPFISVTLNKIRLPLYFKEPNVNGNKTVYLRSDGSRQLLSARLAKKYKGYIDEVLEETHQNLVIALNHDGVYFATENSTSLAGMQVRFEDEYNNNFPEIMQNVNIWSAEFTIFETPFNNFNSNCG